MSVTQLQVASLPVASRESRMSGLAGSECALSTRSPSRPLVARFGHYPSVAPMG